MTAAEVARLVSGVKRERSAYVGLCPVHPDHDPSLRIADGRNGGVIIKCRVGCDTRDVVRALGITMKDLAPSGVIRPAQAPEVVYRYDDEQGRLLYEVVRKIDPKSGKKSFPQRHPDGHGGMAYDMDGVRRVPYRLPELLEAIALGKRIYIPEGEKDCDRLWSIGLAATTNPMGAGKWLPEYARYLEGAEDVVVLADNDAPGREHARQVAATIPGARVVEFPELPEKGDVSDWLDKGHSLEELTRRCDPVRYLTPIDRAVSRDLAVENQRPIDAIPTHLDTWNRACLGFGGGAGLARGWHVVIAAASNKGKSMMALNCAHAALTAGYSVGYILLEGNRRDLLSRLYPLASGENSRLLQPGKLYSPEAFRRATDAFDDQLERAGVRLLVADKLPHTLDVVLAVINEAAAAGCELVIVDYLQLIRVPDVTGIYETTVRLSGAVTEAAVRLGIVTLGLSQYNRNALNDKGQQELTIHGLSGGGALENDADQVLILKPGERDGLTAQGTADLAKNRHGPAEKITVRWDYRTFRVTEPPVRDAGRIAV